MSGYTVNTNEKDLAKFAIAIQALYSGRSNAAGVVTLATGAASTTVNAPNCSQASQVFLFPMTADAAAELAGGVKKQVFTSSGTYTPTPGMAYCIVECVGSGAGGGTATGSATNSNGGGGGGAGSYAQKALTAAAVGASQTVTVGAGGASASNGNDTSFGSLCIGKAGSKGLNSTTGAIGLGGAGGVAGTGDITSPGGSGGAGQNFGSTLNINIVSGQGGGSFFGGGGGGVAAVGGNVATGTAATAFGAGGAGGMSEDTASTASGGAGAPGVCIVTEFLTGAFVSAVANSSFTIAHQNNALSDRTFAYVAIG